VSLKIKHCLPRGSEKEKGGTRTIWVSPVPSLEESQTGRKDAILTKEGRETEATRGGEEDHLGQLLLTQWKGGVLSMGIFWRLKR